jgi:hypothetical protein
MPSRFDPQPEPNPRPEAQPPHELGIDSSKRYDVYCTLRGEATVVYRNVRIKRTTPLFVKDDALSKIGEFVELEQADGNSIFVSRMSVEAICGYGSRLPAEAVKFRPADER